MSQIAIEELKLAFDRIIEKLNMEEVDSVNFNMDMYRHIPANEWQKFEDAQITIGSLSDDIESVRALIQDDDRPCTFVDFDRVGIILNAISETLNPAEE